MLANILWNADFTLIVSHLRLYDIWKSNNGKFVEIGFE